MTAPLPLRFQHARGLVEARAAWTRAEIQSAVVEMIEARASILPTDPGARIVIKPNLNNDLVALTGNCADLRVLEALFELLRRHGYRDVTVADGSNVGIERRNISTFKRLRIDALAKRYNVRCIDLNRDEGRRITLAGGGEPRVANTVLDADFLISVPKVKTHVEATMSSAMKNWVGICVGQDKRHMHRDLGRNIFLLSEVIQPDLIVVDGVVGMEGNGPGDGDPVRLGFVAVADDAFLSDLVVARMVGISPGEVPYLHHARGAGILDDALAARVEAEVPAVRPIRRAPPRSVLAELSESPKLVWLKEAVRPVVADPRVAELAYRAGVIQDVYSLEDDTLRLAGRDASRCGACRKCEDYCPTGLRVEEIGVSLDFPSCVHCLYCWWACPNEALSLAGEPHAMQRQIERYKADIVNL